MNEPAIVLYLRISLPGWVVRWAPGAIEAVATHPDGSVARWLPTFNGGSVVWLLQAGEATLRRHWAELRGRRRPIVNTGPVEQIGEELKT